VLTKELNKTGARQTRHKPLKCLAEEKDTLTLSAYKGTSLLQFVTW